MRGITGLPLCLLLIAAFAAPAAEEATPEPEAQQQDGPPAVTSPWKTRQFDHPLEKVRSELLALIEEDGLAPTWEESPDGTFVTGLVDFDSKKFGVDVSVPPPKLTARYPYAQANRMTSGRFGLEGRLSATSPRRTRIDLRALLEARGMDRRAFVERWIPRVSNGEVERQYFTRLALRLLKPPDVTPPSR